MAFYFKYYWINLYFMYYKIINEIIIILFLPNMSIAYTGLWEANASRFKHHNATPAPKPCNKTIGVFVDSSFKEMVHILSDVPTTGPISTYHPLYAVLKPISNTIILKSYN